MEPDSTVGTSATELPAPPPAPTLIDVPPPESADTEPPPAAAEDEPPPPPPAAAADEVHVAHIVVPNAPFEVMRVGGRAGVRVTETSLNVETRMKRVNGGNDEGHLGVMMTIPAGALAATKELLQSDVRDLRGALLELLGPWLP